MYPIYQPPRIWQELDQFQREMNRLFDAAGSGRVIKPLGYPAINIRMNEDEQIITAEMAGVHPDDIDIDVTGDAITICGERTMDSNIEDAYYHRRERNYGTFSRTIQLPFMVDTNKVEASFKNGILQIRLPRAEADKPKKISITSK
jgi:HSP20 family protein